MNFDLKNITLTKNRGYSNPKPMDPKFKGINTS